jgi:hypothetical protein
VLLLLCVISATYTFPFWLSDQTILDQQGSQGHGTQNVNIRQLGICFAYAICRSRYVIVAWKILKFAKNTLFHSKFNLTWSHTGPLFFQGNFKSHSHVAEISSFPEARRSTLFPHPAFLLTLIHQQLNASGQLKRWNITTSK